MPAGPILLAVIAVLTVNAARAAEQCVTGYNGEDLSTITPLPNGKSQKPTLPLHPCGDYSEDACCPNIGAQEIADAFDHLMNLGGTGGVPIDDERCIQDAKIRHEALKEYMCLYCNPKHMQYMGCCSNPSNDTSTCLDAKPALYGQSGCNDPSKVNTVRLCKSWVEKETGYGGLWGKDGSRYDSCGMMIWVLGPGDTNENPNANPNEILPWGAVDGRSGDDPVVPSVYWEKKAELFVRDIKPPLLDQFMIHIVDDADGGCFDGSGAHKRDLSLVTGVVTLVAILWSFMH